MPRQSQPISKVLLDGFYDPECELSRLRGCPHIMRIIWDNIKEYWKDMVEMPVEPPTRPVVWTSNAVEEDPAPSSLFLTPLSFYDPNVYDNKKLPEFVRPYWPMIKACLDPMGTQAWHHIWPLPSEAGKVNYLSIQESWVEPGTAQRRPGLHVDRLGEVKIKQHNSQTCIEGMGSSQQYQYHRQGAGCARYIPSQNMVDIRCVLSGGIYVASSLSSSCRAWNCSFKPEVGGRLHLNYTLQHCYCFSLQAWRY